LTSENQVEAGSPVFELDECFSETHVTWEVIAPRTLVLDFKTADKEEALRVWRENQPAILQRVVKESFAPAHSMEQWKAQLADFRERAAAEEAAAVAEPEFS